MIGSCVIVVARFAFAVGVLALAAGTPVRAQPAKIFVASTGSDSSDGSRTAPKRSFQAAHDAVAPGGNVVVLDTAGYGTLTISKSVAVTVPPGVNGFVTASSGTNGLLIAAGVADKVSLRGLVIESTGAAGDGVGVLVSKAAFILLEDCAIRGFGTGVRVFASGNGANVIMRGGSVRDVATGVKVAAASSFAASQATISDVLIDGASAVGVHAEGFPNSNALGSVTLIRTTISNSAIGVETSRNGVVTVDGSALISNGLAFNKVSNAGTILTRSNNTLDRNTATINGGNTLTPLDAF